MIFWLLLILFGWLFMGWPFFLYLFVGFIVMVFIVARYPEWFNRL